MKSCLLACALLVAPNAVQAQYAAPAVSPIAAPATNNAVLRVGTEVPLRLSEELTTGHKLLKVGQRFHLETSEALMVQNVIVVPAGTPAIGEITDVRNKGGWGRSGHLAGRVLYLTVNGRQIRLTGSFDDKGSAGGVGAVAVSALIFAPAGFFMTGTSAKLAIGTPIKGFIDEDVPLAFASFVAAPMAVVVPTSPPALTVASSGPVQQPIMQALPAKAVGKR